MYGSVAGAGAVAALPTALAFTGMGSGFVLASLVFSTIVIVLGVVLIRLSYRTR